MFRKRTVSKVTSKVFELGGSPDGGNSKSHWESLIIRGFNLESVALLALRTPGRAAGECMTSKVILKASVPLSTKSRLSLVKLAVSSRWIEVMTISLLQHKKTLSKI